MDNKKNYIDPAPEMTGEPNETAAADFKLATGEDVKEWIGDVMATDEYKDKAYQEDTDASDRVNAVAAGMDQTDYILTAMSLALKSLLVNEDDEGNPVSEGVTVSMPNGDFVVVARQALTDNILIKSIPVDAMHEPQVGVRVFITMDNEQPTDTVDNSEGAEPTE